MIKKKVCMLGAFSVGKTSLVGRFVHSQFSEKYHTTVGVKIDKKTVETGGEPVTLLLWDIHGEDDFQKVRESYFRGSNGYLLVADGTRPATLKTAALLRNRMEEHVGEIPFVLLVNKIDLKREWEVDDDRVRAVFGPACDVVYTSAKTGEHVEEAFRDLARRI